MTSIVTNIDGFSRNEVWRWKTAKRFSNRWKLRYASSKSLGLLEKGILSIEGQLDSKHQLIKKVGNTWTSPFVIKEVDSLQEYCAKAWGALQNDNTYLLAKAKYLMVDIERCSKRIKKIEDEIENVKKRTSLAARKRGEEDLSESVVTARRTKELNRELMPLKSLQDHLEKQIHNNFDAVNAIANALNEFRNTTMIICEKVSEHSRQRIDYYWRSVLFARPDDTELPVMPEYEIPSKYEEFFVKRHNELLLEIEDLNKLINEMYSRKEYVNNETV